MSDKRATPKQASGWVRKWHQHPGLMTHPTTYGHSGPFEALIHTETIPYRLQQQGNENSFHPPTPHPFFPPVYYISSRRRRIQHWAEIAEVIDRVILGEKWSWPVVASSITKYHWRGGRRAWCWAQTLGDWWWAAGGEGRGPAPQRLSTRCPPSLSPLIGSDIFIRIAAARPVTSPCRHAIMPIIIMLHQHHYPPTNPRPAGGGL